MTSAQPLTTNRDEPWPNAVTCASSVDVDVVGDPCGPVNVLWVAGNFASEGRGSALVFFLVAAPLVMALQIALSALLIHTYKARSRTCAMLAGGVIGIAMPVIIFALLWFAASTKPAPWGHYLVDGLVWTMLACSISLFAIGPRSGVSIAYTEWRRGFSSDS